MPDRIDGYLSRRAQGLDAGALVVCRRADDGSEAWLLQRPGHPDLGLGDSQHDASQAIHAWLRAERARRGA